MHVAAGAAAGRAGIVTGTPVTRRGAAGVGTGGAPSARVVRAREPCDSNRVDVSHGDGSGRCGTKFSLSSSAALREGAPHEGSAPRPRLLVPRAGRVVPVAWRSERDSRRRGARTRRARRLSTSRCASSARRERARSSIRCARTVSLSGAAAARPRALASPMRVSWRRASAAASSGVPGGAELHRSRRAGRRTRAAARGAARLIECRVARRARRTVRAPSSPMIDAGEPREHVLASGARRRRRAYSCSRRRDRRAGAVRPFSTLVWIARTRDRNG